MAAARWRRPAAGVSRRRRGSVGAGHAGGASRVAELAARHAAAADDAVLGPLRSTSPPPLRGPLTRRRSTTTRRPSSAGGGLPIAAPFRLGRSPRASSSPSRRTRRRASASLRCFAICSASRRCPRSPTTFRRRSCATTTRGRWAKQLPLPRLQAPHLTSAAAAVGRGRPEDTLERMRPSGILIFHISSRISSKSGSQP